MHNTYVKMYFRVEDIIKKLLSFARLAFVELIFPPVPEVFYLLSATRVVSLLHSSTLFWW